MLLLTRYLIIIISLSIVISTKSQNSKLASLRATKAEQDFGIGEFTSSIDLYNDAIKFENDFPNIDSSFITDSYALIGVSYYQLGEYENAVANLKQSLVLCETLKKEEDYELVARVIGNCYLADASYSKALEYFEIALKQAILNKDYYAQAILENNMGRTFQLKGDPKEAIKRYKKATSLYTQSDSINKDIVVVYENIGLVYFENGDYKKSSKYFLIAIEKSKEYNFDHDLKHDFYYVGKSYLNLKKINESTEYFILALNENDETSDLPFEGKINTYLGFTSMIAGNFEGALIYYKDALSIYKELESLDEVAECEKKIKEINLDLK